MTRRTTRCFIGNNPRTRNGMSSPPYAPGPPPTAGALRTAMTTNPSPPLILLRLFFHKVIPHKLTARIQLKIFHRKKAVFRRHTLCMSRKNNAFPTEKIGVKTGDTFVRCCPKILARLCRGTIFVPRHGEIVSNSAYAAGFFSAV